MSLGTAMWVVVGLAAFIALEALVIVKGTRCERPVWGYRDSRLRLLRVSLGRLKKPGKPPKRNSAPNHGVDDDEGDDNERAADNNHVTDIVACDARPDPILVGLGDDRPFARIHVVPILLLGHPLDMARSCPVRLTRLAQPEVYLPAARDNGIPRPFPR